MKERGTNFLILGGGCGGAVVSYNELDPVSRLTANLPNLSSVARLVTQGGIINKLEKNEDSDEYGSLKLICPNQQCSKVIKRQPHKLLENCPHCGANVRCS